MKFLQNKKATAIALFLALTIAVTLVAVPLANAHDPPWTVSTYAFIEVSPNPVGVGQTAYVNFWLDKVPPTAIGPWGMHWHNFKVTVTKPGGDTEILGPFDSDAVGGAWTQYTPDEPGTYTFEFTFPGQTVVEENPYPYSNVTLQLIPLGYSYINDTYTGSSASTTITVQQDPIETAYPDNPLPTTYWTRPISSMNRNWYTIGGDWLYAMANFNPYTTAPNSAHVLWTKPLAFGGQIGGAFGSGETSLYATGTAYEAKFSTPVIMYGILYYTAYPGAINNPGPLTAVDLRTGQTLWTKSVSGALKAGMIYNFVTGNQYGAHAYLFTEPAGSMGWVLNFAPRIWSMYDAMTGDWILDIANASAGTLVRGDRGEILSYTASGGMLALWNSSKAIEEGSTKNNVYAIYSAAEIWRPPQGATIDWNDGYEWSVPIAADISGAPISPALALSAVSDDVVVVSSPTLATSVYAEGPPGGSLLGYRVDAGYSAVDGHLLWGPINRTLTPFTTVNIGPAGNEVYTEFTAQTMTWIGYSIKTGEKKWGPTDPYNSSWGYYDLQGKGIIGYGNLYIYSDAGEVYAYDVTTGELKWSWNAGSAGVDTPYGVWPFWGGAGVLADGKLYLASSHDYTPPVYKGAKLYALNATTGEEIWSTLDFGGTQGNSRPIADGILLSVNSYDNQIYAYGKGLSATTVEAPMTAITLGDSLIIKGTVTDQSPGQTCLGIPAAGTPAIADESMSSWMEYLYQQQPLPQDATGVTVKLETIDPNGNFYDIGTTTSDASGLYSLVWEPPVPGKYTVIATFQGSESYYASSAETAFAVTEASPTPAPEEPLTLPPTDMYILATGIAIIIAIVIVGILILRKR